MISAKPISPDDREFFDACLSKDELHKSLGISFSDLETANTESFLISDESGPLMTVRLHNALRVAIQFNPGTTYRSAKAANAVIEWFKGIARERKCNEVIIRPGGGAAKFAEKLGFLDFVGKFIGVS
jgi:hypothetical protein